MNKDAFRQIMVILATVVMITINALANILPFNGLTTGAVSDSFKVFFVPAGYVFAIWGLIYLLLIGYTIYQALPAHREDATLRRIGWWYVLSAVVNSAWIFLWHYQQFPFTLVMMLVLLVSLIVIVLNLKPLDASGSTGEKLLLRLPFSVYLGWITVATIANVTDVLDFYHRNGFGIQPQTWVAIMLAVALVVAFLMMIARRDWAFLAVLVWAFIGIAVKFPSEAVVVLSSWVAAGISGVFLLVSLWLSGRKTLR
ncbi:MAG: TspO/MBR family protein [Anaerolineaceae bacterium]